MFVFQVYMDIGKELFDNSSLKGICLHSKREINNSTLRLVLTGCSAKGAKFSQCTRG